MRPHGPKQAEIWAVGKKISVGSMTNPTYRFGEDPVGYGDDTWGDWR